MSRGQSSKLAIGNDRLERIYGAFQSTDFLDWPPPDDEDEKSSQRAFLEWMGVACRPRVDTATTDQRGTFAMGNLSRHPHRKYGSVWAAWLASSPVSNATACDQLHDGQQLRTSHALDRFTELVATGDRDRLAAFWSALAEDWNLYEPAMAAEVHCPHGWHNGPRSRKIPSLAHFQLSEVDWLPCRRGSGLTIAQPRRAWRLAHDTPRRIAERVDVLDAQLAAEPGAGVLASILGVVDAARPAASDVALLLETLAAEHEKEGSGTDVYDAARWAMRTLDDVLDRSGRAGGLSCPPLLARLDGKRVFHRSPAIANDPLVEATWERDVPILDADRDLRRLHRAFQLRNLDIDVRKYPDGDLIDDDTASALRRSIDQAKPYLAALAAHDTPSREEEVFRGLARLEVVAYSELRLRYELDGQSRVRDEAVSYLAVRQEKEGRRRNIGTAHLEIDVSTGEPHWFVFGPQLAQFLNVPTEADAFGLLLQSGRADRERFLAARGIGSDAVEAARLKLKVVPDDDMLDDLIEGTTRTPRSSASPGGSGQSPAGGPTVSDEGPPDGPAGGSPSQREDETPLPRIDFDRVDVVDGKTTEVNIEGSGSRGGGGGLGPAGPVDFARREQIQRRIGRRGEEAAYYGERRRLERMGFDPNAVVWRSERHPFAPYDIESLDEDGQRIYIEVKATSAEDPSEPFEISDAEAQMRAPRGGALLHLPGDARPHSDSSCHPLCRSASARPPRPRRDPAERRSPCHP